MQRLALYWIAACLVGCNPPQPPVDQSAAIRDLKAQITALTNRVDANDASLSQNAKDLGELGVWRSTHDYTSASLDPAQRVYERADANVGSFAVSLTDVHSFADGVRVKINLGNLSAVTFAGAKLKLKYGPRMPTDSKDFWATYNKWQTELKTKEESVTERLLPAHWNPVQVILPGIQEKDFGYLEVSITTNEISMY